MSLEPDDGVEYGIFGERHISGLFGVKRITNTPEGMVVSGAAVDADGLPIIKTLPWSKSYLNWVEKACLCFLRESVGVTEYPYTLTQSIPDQRKRELAKVVVRMARTIYRLKRWQASKNIPGLINGAFEYGRLHLELSLLGFFGGPDTEVIYDEGKRVAHARTKARTVRANHIKAQHADWQRQYDLVRAISPSAPRGRVTHEVACKKVAQSVGKGIRQIKAVVKNPTPNRR
jgi:hypothetical protein